jgi:membrane protease subunit (stomatin/prohibitin family)
MAVKWGTDSKMEYIEPTFNFPVKLGACGEMNLRVEDGRKLLIKVVGTENFFDQTELVRSFRAFLMLKLKPYLVTFIKENKINIFQIDEQLQVMSAAMKTNLEPDFADYGIALERFFITTVVKPEDDKNYLYFRDLNFRQYASIAEAQLQQKLGIIEQQTEAQKTVIEAQALAQKRSIEGYTYQQERQFDVAEGFASNEAAGQIANMGVGLGMISGIGGAVGDKVGGFVQGAFDKQALPPSEAQVAAVKCSRCGSAIPANSRFCLECGEKIEQAPAENKVICPGCKAEVAAGKFCIECGAPLSIKCSNCSAELPAGAKFCPECGTNSRS